MMIVVFNKNDTENIKYSYELFNETPLEFSKRADKWLWLDDDCHLQIDSSNIVDLEVSKVILSSFTNAFEFDAKIVVSSEKIKKRKEIILSIIREHRNKKLIETDKFLMISDFPISNEEKEIMTIYRRNLRNLPEHINDNNMFQFVVKTGDPHSILYDINSEYFESFISRIK
jgi:hypothetical protein